MVIAQIFSNLFNGLELTYQDYRLDLGSNGNVTSDVKFHFGDSKELAKWVRGRSGQEKYPLIWYLIDTVENNNSDFIKSNCSLVLFTSTRQDYYNDTRSLVNFSNILEPLATKVFSLVDSNPQIQTIFRDDQNMYQSFDLPNYGIDDIDTKLKGTIDIVDAKRIEFQARFNKKCLIK